MAFHANHGRVGSRHQLVVLGVGEPHKGQVVSGESLGRWKRLGGGVGLNVVKVARVLVARQLGHDRSHAVPDRSERPGPTVQLAVLEKRVLLDLLDTTVA